MQAFHDLSGIFQSTEQPMFIDFTHVGEVGNERIARRIGADVMDILKRTTPSRPKTLGYRCGDAVGQRFSSCGM
jgi:hypothetical protein